jgi:hypothetical protein
MKIGKQMTFREIDFNDKKKVKEYVRIIDSDLANLFLALQGRVRFGDETDGAEGENISGMWQVVADTGTANTEFAVTHTLGSVPVGYLVTKISNAGVIYDSGTTWTTTNIYLKSSAANSAVTLFLLK